MSVREELNVINSKWPCQTAWRIHSKIYMEMHALWFILTGYSHCCFKYFSKSFHSRWSISALLIISINLKHENNNMATSHWFYFLGYIKILSDRWSFWFCHQQVVRRSASCCSDFPLSPSNRRLTELQHSLSPKARTRFWSWNWNGLFVYIFVTLLSLLQSSCLQRGLLILKIDYLNGLWKFI